MVLARVGRQRLVGGAPRRNHHRAHFSAVQLIRACRPRAHHHYDARDLRGIRSAQPLARASRIRDEAPRTVADRSTKAPPVHDHGQALPGTRAERSGPIDLDTPEDGGRDLCAQPRRTGPSCDQQYQGRHKPANSQSTPPELTGSRSSCSPNVLADVLPTTKVQPLATALNSSAVKLSVPR